MTDCPVFGVDLDNIKPRRAFTLFGQPLPVSYTHLLKAALTLTAISPSTAAHSLPWVFAMILLVSNPNSCIWSFP